MNKLVKIILTFAITITSSIAFAQNNGDVSDLIKQGVSLHDQGKYAEAIEKYKEALKIDTGNFRAYYEMSFSLYASGKGQEALPYLQKAIAPGSPYQADAYDMLGNIYDDDKQSEKAVEYYSKGIQINPTYQRLRFNLAITYYKLGRYIESEKSAITAIKLDPKHASSQRVYAMTAFKLHKRACSLLAWCSFILLEPNTQRSVDAYKNIYNIVNYGITQTGVKSVTISISDADLGSGNLLMPMAVTTATDSNSTGGRKNLTAVDTLALQLTSLFKIATAITGDKEDSFVVNYFSKFFEKLGNSDNMPAFARLVSLSAYRQEDMQWFKENDEKLSALDAWVANTKREE
jgi:tetratricopeptide (TPR) repeat protein